jgi:hypothetical protein
MLVSGDGLLHKLTNARVAANRLSFMARSSVAEKLQSISDRIWLTCFMMIFGGRSTGITRFGAFE